MKKLKRVWLILLLPAAIALTFLSSRSADFSEWYAVTVYPVLSRAINAAASLFPFSLAELFTPLLLLFLIGYCFWAAIGIFRNREQRRTRAVKFGVNLLCFLSAGIFAFTICCGINYSRHTFAEVCGLEISPSSKEELAALCEELISDVNALRNGIKEDGNSVMALSAGISGTAKEAQKAFQSLEQSYPTLKAGYGPPKPVFFSRLMSRCNITGMFFPFTFEANVNIDVPDYSIPATMCHELTHLRGYMREDEANFIAYLASRSSSSPDFRYSGAMLAFVHANNALYSTDPQLAGELYAKLDAGARRDFAANNEYWDQFKGPIADTAEKVNDAYLKANRQEDGVKSYGRMVDLLLADYRQRHSG